jgi:D-amino-acid dehydrogenase
MRIAVVGAGAAGVLTAWELALDGHEVTVFERRLTAGEEATFGHGGLLAPACCALGLGQSGALTKKAGRERAGLWRRAFGDNAARALDAAVPQDDLVLALALLSQARLAGIVSALEIEWQHSAGVLVLLRDGKERDRLEAACQALRDAEIPVESLSADAAFVLEPGIDQRLALAGALRLPQDYAGNCRQLILQVRAAAERKGVGFRFGDDVVQVEGGTRPSVVASHHGGTPAMDKFDTVVLCGGTGAVPLLEKIGLRLQFSRLRTHSISAPVHEPSYAPEATVIDSRHPAVITRFGDRVRVAGAAVRGSAGPNARTDALKTLYTVLEQTFPGAARLSAGVQEWQGERLAMPDDLPVLGPSGVPGIWLHLAHGVHGWALAPGAARLLANALSEPALPEALERFGVSRLETASRKGR